MSQPELSVRNSGFGGRGYVHPLMPDPALPGEDKRWIVPSVTTVLKSEATPAITQWAVDQTAAFAAANPEALLQRSPEKAWGYLRWYWNRNPDPLEEGYDVRNYADGVLHDAADLGTTMHEWMQADIVEGLAYPDTTNKGDEFWQMVEVWDDWRSKQFIEPIMTEATVWSTVGYAGTFDYLWKINGQLCFGDIKTSRGLWPAHSRQLSALKMADWVFTKDDEGNWSQQDWQPIVQEASSLGFLHVRPDDITTQGEEQPRYIEYVEAEDLDLHYNGFLGCLAMKQSDLELKRRVKARKDSE